MNKLLLTILCFGIGQTIVWFITNAQFLNKWAAAHPWFMSLVISASSVSTISSGLYVLFSERYL